MHNLRGKGGFLKAKSITITLKVDESDYAKIGSSSHQKTMQNKKKTPKTEERYYPQT